MIKPPIFRSKEKTDYIPLLRQYGQNARDNRRPINAETWDAWRRGRLHLPTNKQINEVFGSIQEAFGLEPPQKAKPAVKIEISVDVKLAEKLASPPVEIASPVKKKPNRKRWTEEELESIWADFSAEEPILEHQTARRYQLWRKSQREKELPEVNSFIRPFDGKWKLMREAYSRKFIGNKELPKSKDIPSHRSVCSLGDLFEQQGLVRLPPWSQPQQPSQS